ncbi:aldehyde dehydrogenase family protein [Mycolicibacterium peregrinum]|uniref:Aldehyde dehydrogenase family protein n=1 Tax=Mycolicibacterium peregrinum TaxID=43304 RepID=A0A4Z0HLK8_MYCPR|nr:aldehyde dehydrogenase family protein [Mycolicibacterium peregrinum]TGB40463.1 aldehyde dehydrogenase family protein [Mycolicibacterium peregrinum]TGB42923.1 aldehyde dehydrogenase family protein [Mycolicibacterium peregrinum]
MQIQDSNYIDGKWAVSSGNTRIPVINPANDEVIAEVVAGTAADVDAAVAAARAAFPAWSATPVGARADYLTAIAGKLAERSEDLARTISSEMGCPITISRAIQLGLPLNSFAEAANIVREYEFENEYRGSTIVREPFGVLGAITPWNYPLHQIALKVAYGLAAGNTVVVKPSEVTPLCALALTEIIDEIGLPPGVFNLVFGTGADVGEAIAGHDDVDIVSFTGSTRAGRRVQEVAARTVKRVSLELGGKSPNIILDDADLESVVPASVKTMMLNSGQTCSALTRMIVPRDRLAEVEALAKATADALPVGDPSDEGTALGPLSSRAQQERVIGHIRTAMSEGARLVTGGDTATDGPGAFLRPTVFSDVTEDMTIHREEVFGPVLAIEAYDSEDDAVRIANATDYGLAGAVWSASPERAESVARRIRAGQVQINAGAFNANAPFGGYKQSGNGREAGRYGLEEFLEIKSIQR